MSIPVTIDDLPATLEGYPWGYLVTVNDTGRAHSLAVPTRWADGALHMSAGRGTRSFATARPEVTMVFPGVDGEAYSLIVDGAAVVGDDTIAFHPSSAVLHRPALG